MFEVNFLERADAAGRDLRQQGRRRAAADAGHLGARGDPRRRRGVRRRLGRGHLRRAPPHPSASSSPSRHARAERRGPPMTGAELLRAPLFHTPANPFRDERALVCHEDGGLLDPRRAHRGERRLRRAASHASRRGHARLARRLRAAGLRRHARALSRSCASSAAWAGRCSTGSSRSRCRKKRAWPTSPTPPARRDAFRRRARRHGTTTALVFGAHFASGHGGALRGRRRRGPADDQRPGRVGSATCDPSCTSRRRTPTATARR